jgi:ATP-dependent DNA helicase RecQ
MALTATATEKVREDIIEKLRPETPEKVIRFKKSFQRDNLSFIVRKVEDKGQYIAKALKKSGGSTGIVYVSTRKAAEQYAGYLRKHGISATFFHGGLSNDEKSKRLEAWMNKTFPVMVATNAFGMGIDKPDVRIVAHFDISDSLEAYYQEAGRAGRDGEVSFALAVYTEKDILKLQNKVELTFPSESFIRRVYQCIANYYKIAVGSYEYETLEFELEAVCEAYQLPLLETFNAIKVLGLLGFFQWDEASFAPSKLKIEINNKELYKFQVAHPDFDDLIKFSLRLFGGEVFSHYVSISERKLAERLTVSEADVQKRLAFLEKQGVVSYVPRKTKPHLTFLTPRRDAAQLHLKSDSLDFLIKREKERVASVIQYLKSEKMCRSRFLAEYFGQKDTADCGKCDVCKEKLAHTPEEYAEIVRLTEEILLLLQKRDYSLPELEEELSTSPMRLSLAIEKLMVEERVAYQKEGKLALISSS